jgi:hypothetical protein
MNVPEIGSNLLCSAALPLRGVALGGGEVERLRGLAALSETFEPLRADEIFGGVTRELGHSVE